MKKLLFWSAQGREKTFKEFKAIEGYKIKIDGLNYDTVYYKSEIDGYYYIVLLNCGVSISNGKTLRYARNYLESLIQRQGVEKINNKIKENIESSTFPLAPEEKPTLKNQLLKLCNEVA